MNVENNIDESESSFSETFLVTAFAIAVAFSTYFCMYAFRKPFSAASYEDMKFLGTNFDLKTIFVISQIVGYTLSKLIGIKVVSEVSRQRRFGMLVGLIFVAQLALFGFAFLPPAGKVISIFFNGLPLGMVWGLVVWYLEGRKTSEMLLAGLSCSFIVASGVVKDIGRWLMSAHDVDQFWMPFVTGCMFLPPFLLSAYLLNRLPEPTAADKKSRMARSTMDGKERWAFVKKFLPGMIMLLIAYFFLTAYRDFRDNFGVDIFDQLGYGKSETTIFTRSELWVAFGVVGTLAVLNLIRNNLLGLIGAFVVMTGGCILMGAGTLLYDTGTISGLQWMIMCGLGSYLAYVPYGSVLFDRLIASTRVMGTAVFVIYIADSIGYVGSISVMAIKDQIAGDMTRLEFFRQLTYGMSGLGIAMLVSSLIYFLKFHDHGSGIAVTKQKSSPSHRCSTGGILASGSMIKISESNGSLDTRHGRPFRR
ncbi:MAG: hypothetical protein HON92_02030 [Planctomycetaceae bacterium]|nr:hypothetical protein [Planctomycetaceae bacterium]MBT4844186.1 hypothetical protein [Planctomycetaceae bacterium]MBT5883234.1 hypothetical protein [Planctomycetaceae bacterium]